MKKKVLLLSLALMLTLTGVVSAAAMWGTYKGNQIVRITVDGVPVKVSDVPAMMYNNRTMIPIYLLKEAGIDYSWNSKTQTVDIKGQKKASEIKETENHKLTIKEIYEQSVAVGYVEAFDANGNVACSGSGVMVTPNFFVTNYHVATCGGTGKVKVKIAGGTYHNGTEAWYSFENESTDLYGMMVSTSFDADGFPTGDVPPTVFNIIKTKLPEIGDKVYAIGSPLGYENTVSEGIISGIRKIDGITYIQHTADTEHGSSGGALLDDEGHLIGITSAGYEGTNVDFAIPISYVKTEIDKL